MKCSNTVLFILTENFAVISNDHEEDQTVIVLVTHPGPKHTNGCCYRFKVRSEWYWLSTTCSAFRNRHSLHIEYIVSTNCFAEYVSFQI